MKKSIFLFFIASSLMVACNDSASDSVEKADSINDEKQDTSTSAAPTAIQTDQATTDFLVKAADGGIAEVNAAKLAQDKGTNAGVKRFAAMMVQDHTGANTEVKKLAAARNVTIPETPSEDNQKKAAKLAEKTGKNFDKDFMDMMVDDHKKTIDLFEDIQKKSTDTEVKNFVTNTLPALRTHLDSAQAIRKALK